MKRKNAACTKTGLLLFQEIQRGKLPMKRKKFSQVGATAACTLRLIEGVEYCGLKCQERVDAKKASRRHLVIADSWFGSVKLAETLKLLHRVPTDNDGNYTYEINKDKGRNPNGHEIIASVKSNSGWFPRKQIESKMKDWPGGSYLVLECKTPENGVDLVAIGYKYNSRRVLTFVMTKDAGSTAPGINPYIARFPDKYGNVCERKVQRPEIIEEFFDKSDVIDSHNHCRQFRLALERLWLTQNAWMRLDFTFVGMAATDTLRAIQFHTEEGIVEAGKGRSVADFADSLAWDCVHNKYPQNNNVAGPRSFIAPIASSQLSRSTIIAESIRDHCHAFVDMVSDSVLESGGEESSFNSYEGDDPPPPSRIILEGDGLTTRNQPRNSNESTLTDDSSFNSHFQAIQIGEHDAVESGKSSKYDETRSTKRKCIICGSKTTSTCNNNICQHRRVNHKGSVHFGTPICRTTVGPRKNLTEYGGPKNTLTCLQIHRDQIRKCKTEEYKKNAERRKKIFAGSHFH